MDAEALEKSRQREKEKLRQEILRELKQQYYLKPKNNKLEVSDILEKYKEDLLERTGKEFAHNGWSQYESICQGIRRVVCLHFGCYVLKDIPQEKYQEFREEFETFIVEYLGIRRKD